LPFRKKYSTMKSFNHHLLQSFALLFFVFTLASCDKEKEVEFDLTFSNVAVTVGPLNAPKDMEKTYLTKVFTLNTEAELNTIGASLQDIQSAKLKTLKVTIKSPAGRTFNDISFA